MVNPKRPYKRLSASAGTYPGKTVRVELYYRQNEQYMTEIYFEIFFKQSRKEEKYVSLLSSCSSEETGIKLATAEIQRQIVEWGFVGAASIHDELIKIYFDNNQEKLF